LSLASEKTTKKAKGNTDVVPSKVIKGKKKKKKKKKVFQKKTATAVRGSKETAARK